MTPEEKAAAFDRMMAAGMALSDHARYVLLRAEGESHKCVVEGCNLSQEEHHRLAYGMISELQSLRREVDDLRNGRVVDA